MTLARCPRIRFRLVLLPLILLVASLLAPAAEPTTVADPAIPPEDLALRLEPLTTEEIGTEAEAWRDLVKGKATEIAEAQIARRRAESPEGEDAASLATLRTERDSLLRRFGVVLDAYELKGGDAAAYRKYAAAVSGIEAGADVEERFVALKAWLFSKDGGTRWGIRILQFIGILVAFWLLAGLTGSLVAKALNRSEGLTGLIKAFLKKTARRVVLLIGLLIALGTLDVNVGAAFALIGGGAFILGFALQDSLGNLASGLMLMFNRPFDVGDAVEVGGIIGKVDGVSLVSTTLLTVDNRKVIVPNKAVWGQTITNITGMPTRRVDLVFGVGYGDDLDKAQAILERVVREHPLVLDDPAPRIAVRELADSSVNFICWPWAKTSDYLTVACELTKQIKVEFDKAGITIPFPQRDVHFHQAGPTAEMPSAGENS